MSPQYAFCPQHFGSVAVRSTWVCARKITPLNSRNAIPSFAAARRRPRASAGGGAPERPDKGNGDSSEDDDGDLTGLDMDALRRRMREVEETAKEWPSDESGSSTGGEDGENRNGISIGLDDGTVYQVDEDNLEPADEDSLRKLTDEFLTVDKLYVIIFSHGSSSEEGVYSLSLNDVNIVLAFQTREEALRYAVMLSTQNFPKSKVGEFDATQLKDFCSESGFRLGMVPSGSLLTPPDETIDGNLDEWAPDGIETAGADGTVALEAEDVEGLRKALEGMLSGEANHDDIPDEENDLDSDSGSGGSSGGNSSDGDDSGRGPDGSGTDSGTGSGSTRV